MDVSCQTGSFWEIGREQYTEYVFVQTAEQNLTRNKNFELREDEDDIQAGDLLVLEEFIPYRGYTGNGVRRSVKYVLRNCPEYGLKQGYCIIGW